jgi:hypothetical protein
MRRWLLALVAALGLAMAVGPLVQASPVISGQRNFAKISVEPAIDDTTGATIFLLTPTHVAVPVSSNPKAWAPMYLPMYPVGSTISQFNCTPQNCDHVNVLPSGLVAAFGLQSVYPKGTITTPYGTFTGGLVAGHDHLVGTPTSHSDFNVAWHVFLILFTPKGVADGAINHELLTDASIDAAMANGDVVPQEIDSGITFNCSIVPESVYLNGQ